MARFPVSPRYARMLLLGQRHGLLPYVITVVAALSVDELFTDVHTSRHADQQVRVKQNGVIPRSGGAGRTSEVERSLMVRWVVGSILHGVDPLSYFSFQPVIHDWCKRPWYVLSCLWDGAYKRTLAVNR